MIIEKKFQQRKFSDKCVCVCVCDLACKLHDYVLNVECRMKSERERDTNMITFIFETIFFFLFVEWNSLHSWFNDIYEYQIPSTSANNEKDQSNSFAKHSVQCSIYRIHIL